MKRLIFVAALTLLGAGLAWAAGGVRQKQAKPYEYGTILINNHSAAAGRAPAVFEHWIHRSRFTCRLCHVDIGFAMKTGASDIRATDNARGYFCGTCHNGLYQVNGKPLFAACSTAPVPGEEWRCAKCHQKERDPGRIDTFIAFASKLPKERLGNGVNWELAEEKGLLKLIDYLPGISMQREKMAIQKDFALEAKVSGLPEIVFSHKKHTVWNGCEVCHPEVFAGVKRGSTKYSMLEINEGKYCGICHRSVAFPMQDCQRCHSKPIK